MNNQTSPTPTRVRLYSHVTKTRFLHIEDALNIGKVRLFGGTYNRGQGMSDHVSHYLDMSDARIVFHALLNAEQGFNYREYKGTPPKNGQPATSRVLSVAVKGDNVYVELKSGPGKLTPTGAITPNGPAKVEVNVTFKLYEARRMATAVLAYLHAWDVLRMMYHHGVMGYQQSVGQPAPYLLVAAASEQIRRAERCCQTPKRLRPKQWDSFAADCGGERPSRDTQRRWSSQWQSCQPDQWQHGG